MRRIIPAGALGTGASRELTSAIVRVSTWSTRRFMTWSNSEVWFSL
jgi:hypothetical protein